MLPALGLPQGHPSDPLSFFAKEGVDPLRHAFDRKVAVHSGTAGRPLDAEVAAAVLEDLWLRPRKGPTAAYFHIPFCRTRCSYCGFFARHTRKDDSRTYTDALLSELDRRADLPASASAPIHAVYLGGGTPTDLEPEDLLRLLDGIRTCLPLANDCEITLEGRVRGFAPALWEAALRGGVNRVSVGVQSFDTEARRRVGRLDDRDTVLRTLEYLAEAGQASVVVDLVYGFPGQSLEDWTRDVHTLGTLPLDGADLYQLNVLPHTLLAQRIQDGLSAPAADLPLQAEMFLAGVEAMKDLHWDRLSISHWRSGPRERSLYNRLVKSGASILPFGSGAGGYLHGHRIFQERNYERYLSAAAAGAPAPAHVMTPSPIRALAAAIGDGLDQGRLDLARLEALVGGGLRARIRPLLAQWEACGLLRQKQGWVCLTRAGAFWNVNLAQSLVSLCEQGVGSPLHASPEEKTA